MTRLRLFALLATTLLLAACGAEPATRQGRSKQRTFSCPADKDIDERTARRFSAEALPGVWQVLEDLGQRECWPAALLVAGQVGGADAVARLRAFVEGQAPLFAMGEDMVLLQQSFRALGHLAENSSDARAAEQALDYLMESTEPLNWVKRSIDWNVDAVIRRELIRVISGAAVTALGLVNRKEAEEHLLQMALDAAERRAFRFKFQTVSDAEDDVEDLVNLHVIPPGRVVFAMGETLGRLKGTGEDEMRVLVEKVRSDALDTWTLERSWLAARRGQEGFDRAVRRANAVADARLSGFHGQLESLVHLMDSAEARKAIDEVDAITFPKGPLTLINAEHEEQVRTVLARMERLRKDKARQLELLRLGSHVDTVIEAHQAFQRALESGESGAGFDAVIRSRAKLQNALRVLIATVIARFPGWREGDRSKRATMLESLLEQNEQVDSYLRRRVPVRDVNPDTGQELAPLNEGGGTTRQGRPATPEPD